MTLRLVTATAALAVTLADAKAHLRVVGTDEDTLITAMIVAATEAAEHATGRVLMAQTWEAGFDSFADAMELTRVPVLSITSLTYIDAVGVLQTLSSSLYTLAQDDSGFAQITPVYGSTWPILRGDMDGVKVRFVAGYESAALVPQSIKSWILLHCGTTYENRESEVIKQGNAINLAFADALLHRFKVYG